MTCNQVKTLLSEFADETLDVSTSWQVQTHLADCLICHRMNQELQSLRQMLQALPAQQPSAQFEASLAQRLALTRRPQPRRTWHSRLRQAFSIPGLRPALACGIALSAVAAIVWSPQPAAPRETSAARIMDQKFVADCVAQHRREAAAEPLADLAAQNLAGHLDNTSLSAPATADAGLF